MGSCGEEGGVRSGWETDGVGAGLRRRWELLRALAGWRKARRRLRVGELRTRCSQDPLRVGLLSSPWCADWQERSSRGTGSEASRWRAGDRELVANVLIVGRWPDLVGAAPPLTTRCCRVEAFDWRNE